jgi:lipopolysaccharide/colanic/teichoic acid biosynthesis glycosyltransferase
MIKRIFDTAVALVAVVLLLPFFGLIALAVKLDSPGAVIFKQCRMGRNFRPFWIYKFRTMVADAPAQGGELTVGADGRITRVGAWLRRFKLDELPQLVNIIKGDMALVGPRPEVPRYVEMFRRDYEEILKLRPGLTDLASLKYRDEAALLAQAENPEAEYVARLLPDKIRLAKEYRRRAGLLFDLRLTTRTIFTLLGHGGGS